MDAFSNFFRRPNIAAMLEQRDIDGLQRLLQQADTPDALLAAQALAQLGDGGGWRYLIEALQHHDDPLVRMSAVDLLAELARRGPSDARRAHSALTGALDTATTELRGPLRAALADIEALDREIPRSGEADKRDPLPPVYAPGYAERIASGYAEPLPDILSDNLPMPHTSDIQFLDAEAHLNSAVELREAELAERGLVETRVALWLKPRWAYADYLRGVLYEDLERETEAVLAYRSALALDPQLPDAREALHELEENAVGEPAAPADLLPALEDADWRARRDAAARLGAQGAAAAAALPGLLALLDDSEREVRHAALAALAQIGGPAGAETLHALTNQRESSWLLRFSIIDALAALRPAGLPEDDGTAAALYRVLSGEMERMAEVVFDAQRDPLHEVEYERMMEIGALAFQRSGDLPGLLAVVEGNVWEFVEDGEEEDAAEDWEDGEGEGEAADEEELTMYVDEVSLMACAALERLAAPELTHLTPELLRRLAAVPDLTLFDPEEVGPDGAPLTAVAYDLSALRAAAAAEFARRESAV